VLLLTAQFLIGQTPFNYKNDFKKILNKTKDQHDSLSYDKLLKRFTSNDASLTNYEVLALLIGYTDKPEYKPYSDLSTERKIYNLNGESKYKDALELGGKFIKTHPLSVKIIFEIAYAYHKLNNEDSANYFVQEGRKIFKAMYYSGDGKTPETPTFALGPADGQDYIHKFIGADIGIMGSGRDKDSNFLDILEAKFKNGDSANFYFIIQHATAKMFEGGSIEEELKKKKKKNK